MARSDRPPAGLPWRGDEPGAGRDADVVGRPSAGAAASAAGGAVAGRPAWLDGVPEALAWRDGLRLRKRWRYVGVFGEELMLCAARVEIGFLSQCFWTVWDRREGREYGHTRMRPGGEEVVLDGPRVAIRHREVRAELLLGTGAAAATAAGDEGPPAVETACASGERGGWGWTRKRAGVPVRGTVWLGGQAREVEAAAVDDVSAGYHRRATEWLWSAGVGEAADGRPLAWNLVEGINDPPAASERTIWLGPAAAATARGAAGPAPAVAAAAEIREPGPVRFDGLDAVEFASAGRLTFTAECERSRRDNLLLIRSSYRHRFGSFSGELDGVELASGLGVMESHEARW